MESQTLIFAGQVITAVVTVAAALIALFGKRIPSKAEDNENMKLGNELLRGLLEDARSERAALKITIDDLRADRVAHVAAVERLEALLQQKDTRIAALELAISGIAAKLGRGEIITLTDLVGVHPTVNA